MEGSNAFSSPERGALTSHPVEWTPTVSPASTRAGSPEHTPIKPSPQDIAPRLLDLQALEALTPVQGEESRSLGDMESHPVEWSESSFSGSVRSSLDEPWDPRTRRHLLGEEQAPPGNGSSSTLDPEMMNVTTRQGLAIRTRPTPPIAAASPTTDIIDGLLGEVIRGRLTSRDTPEQPSKSSRLWGGQEHMSVMEGDKSGELKIVSPETGIQNVDKPPQNVALPVSSPKARSPISRLSPFSNTKAAEALEDWADQPVRDFQTIASFQLPTSPEGGGGRHSGEGVPSRRSGGFEFPPFIRRSEESTELIMGDEPGEFEVYGSEGRRFRFVSPEVGDADHTSPTTSHGVSTFKTDPQQARGAAEGREGKSLGSGIEDHGVKGLQEGMTSVTLSDVQGRSPRSSSTPTRKRDRGPEGPFVESAPKTTHPKLSSDTILPAPGSRSSQDELPGTGPSEAQQSKPTTAEKLVMGGIDIADPSGATPSLTPSEAQVAQATSLATGKVDAVSGHSTLDATDVGLPRDSTELLDGTQGSHCAPSPESAQGSARPATPQQETNSGTDGGLRIHLPRKQAGSAPSGTPRTTNSTPGVSPVHPSFVETPSRVMDRPEPAGPNPVDTRHIDSAAANILRAAEAVGATSLVPILSQQTERLKEQHHTPSPDIRSFASTERAAPVPVSDSADSADKVQNLGTPRSSAVPTVQTPRGTTISSPESAHPISAVPASVGPQSPVPHQSDGLLETAEPSVPKRAPDMYEQDPLNQQNHTSQPFAANQPLLYEDPASTGAQDPYAHKSPLLHTVAYEDDENEHVLPGKQSSENAEFLGEKTESPLLRPGAGQQAQEKAVAAAEFDNAVLPQLNSIATESSVEIHAAEPSTPHKPEGVLSPFTDPKKAEQAGLGELRGPGAPFGAQQGSTAPGGVLYEDIVTTGSKDIDDYIDSEARANSGRHSLDNRDESPRPSSNLPRSHQLQGSADIANDDSELDGLAQQNAPTTPRRAGPPEGLEITQPADWASLAKTNSRQTVLNPVSPLIAEPPAELNRPLAINTEPATPGRSPNPALFYNSPPSSNKALETERSPPPRMSISQKLSSPSQQSPEKLNSPSQQSLEKLNSPSQRSPEKSNSPSQQSPASLEPQIEETAIREVPQAHPAGASRGTGGVLQGGSAGGLGGIGKGAPTEQLETKDPVPSASPPGATHLQGKKEIEPKTHGSPGSTADTPPTSNIESHAQKSPPTSDARNSHMEQELQTPIDASQLEKPESQKKFRSNLADCFVCFSKSKTKG